MSTVSASGLLPKRFYELSALIGAEDTLALMRQWGGVGSGYTAQCKQG